MATVASSGEPDARRALPSIDHLLQTPDAQRLLTAHRRDRVVEALRLVLHDVRRGLAPSHPAPMLAEICRRAETTLTTPPALISVINATGVGLHTNLGRAPLATAAINAMVLAARDAVNVEMDLLSGKRADRDDHVRADLCALTGAEAALVVNNNAAAVLLVVNTLALGKEVIVSRGELVEIGGSFRMPDVMERSGARLREVGTTNRTYVDDFRAAITPATGLLLKVHTSNFRIVGFTTGPSLAELVALGSETGIPVAEDLGSGALIDLTAFGLPAEPMVRDRVATGVGLVTFSGDKVLGGPQAGLIVGQRALIEQVAKNPLRRALRPSKLTIAALAATLRLYRESPDLTQVVPVLRWLTRPLDEMNVVGAVAIERLRRRLGSEYQLELVDAEAEVGSGAVPAQPLPSRAIAITHPSLTADVIATRFRTAQPAIVGRVHGGRLLLDLRGIYDAAHLDPQFS